MFMAKASASPRVRPTYHDRGHHYRADSCRALVEAEARGDVVFHAVGRAGYPGRALAGADLPGLCSAGSWDAGPRQSWGLPEHRNEGIEITFLASGHCPVAVEGRPHALKHDEVLVTRPWQPHRLGDPFVRSCRVVWIVLDVGVRRPHQDWQWPPWIILGTDDLSLLTRCLRKNEQPIWPATKGMQRAFASLSATLEIPADAGRISRLAVAVNEILMEMAAFFRDHGPTLRAGFTSGERTVRMFLPELQETFAEPWSVESMADTCQMGVTKFIEHFRKITNRTPARWLLECRLIAAAAALHGSARTSVTDIAMACGFSSSQYFATVFTRHYGCGPREFRARGTAGPVKTLP